MALGVHNGEIPARWREPFSAGGVRMLLNQMPDIDELLAVDHATLPQTKKLLAAFHPELQRALNLGATMYTALMRAMAHSG